MKRIIALLTVIFSLLSLVACGDEKYPPVKSTEEEASVVMTIDIEGKKYEVKYELYRALFLNLRASVDGGDATVWSGENSGEYVAKIDALIKERVSEIYSVIHIAGKLGIDIYSSEFDEKVSLYIGASVEGGYYGETKIEGFDGDYDAYLAWLKSVNLNYSAQDLLLRYSIANEKIYEHYAGYVDGEFVEDTVLGALKYTKEDVLAFYNSNECVRVLRAYLPATYFTEERARKIHAGVIENAAYGDEKVSTYIINQTTTSAADIINGEIIAKHNLDRQYYSELVDAAFKLSHYEVSELIYLNTGYEYAYVVLYKIAKNSSHFDECYEDVETAYVQNEIGKIIDTAAAGILESIKTTVALDALDRSTVSMD